MVMIDAVSRLVPGVLHNEFSAETESFHNDLLEYPQYSRPEVWHEKSVPKVLLSGDHKKITAWRLEQSKERTKLRRPDLYEKYQCKERLIKQLLKNKRDNIHLIEGLSRGNSEILFWEKGNVLLYNPGCRLCMMITENKESGERMLQLAPTETEMFITSQEYMNDLVYEKFQFVVFHECIQACYTKKEALPVKHKDIRPLELKDLDYVAAHYPNGSREYLEERICAGVMYGAYADERLVAFVGSHDEGSMGMMYVEEDYRHRGIGESLAAYKINRELELGYIPYDHIIVGNEASVKLQEKLGLYFSKGNIWWQGRE